MELTATRFIEVLTAATPDTVRGEAQDKRRQPRFGIRAAASIIPLSETSSPKAINVQVRDASPSGIGFLHDKKMALDEQFALILPREGEAPSVVLCAVAFWQPISRDLFAIGARFLRVLRDGGVPPLPVKINQPAGEDLAEEVKRLHRLAS